MNADPHSSGGRTEFAPTQEVRFALVLYGGVSLAVYINGVVQEFLRLVRATAPGPPSELGPDATLYETAALTGTERVYRKLGQMLAFGSKSALLPSEESPVTTRFVVDVISGSSAGGLNGIYLGKALANEQSIDELRTMWVDEGDIARLLNDRASYAGVGSLRPGGPPQSLLNGRRMYWKLLSALDAMDTVAPPESSRLVDALDVWITTTDLRGLLLPIRLADAVVYEPRHRNVLHFSYADSASNDLPRNDFRKELNPLLAFAARATSSFPFAFEPTTLADIDEFVQLAEFRGYSQSSSKSAAFAEFFDDYVSGRRRISDDRDLADFYRSDAFADGGYLDNKPFGWAIDSIARRRADLPVVRRLAYVEPSPSKAQPAVPIEDRSASESALEPPPWTPPTTRPDVLENSLAAAYGLPRSEAIRDDLERVVERNRELARAREITAMVDRTADAHPNLMWPLRDLDNWLRLTSEELTSTYGLAYAAFHHLRLARVFDDIASYVAAALNFPDRGDEQAAIRLLIEAWFEKHYGAERPGWTHTRFLYRYDLGYRLRRLRYLSIRLEGLLRLDAEARQFLGSFLEPATDLDEDATRAELRDLKREMNRIRAVLTRTDQRLRARATVSHPLAAALTGLDIPRSRLLGVLEAGANPTQRLDAARSLLAAEGTNKRLTLLARELKRYLLRVLQPAGRSARERLADASDAPLDVRRAREAVRFIYEQYENYDLVSFPLSYGTLENATRIEVMRISPQDATSLIDETSPTDGRHKLAGDQLAHFGGFFDRSWRRNDMLWGRLDAAERIIDSLLLPSDAREQLLTEAQHAIIEEEFDLVEQGPLVAALAASMLTDEAGAQESLARLAQVRGPDALIAALTSSLDATAIREHLKKDYEYSKAVDRHRLLGVAGRATRVTGQVLDGLSERAPAVTSPARWLVRAGRLTWWLAEVTTPRSLKQMLFQYWFALLLLLSVVMIAGGTLVAWPEVTRAGWVLLAVIAGARLVTLIVSDLLADRIRVASFAVATAGLAVLGFALVELFVHFDEDVDRVAGWFPNVGGIDADNHPTEWELRVFAIGALALGCGLLVAGYFVTRGRERTKVLQLEFARTPDDLEALVGLPGSVRRATARRIVFLDYGFIATYTAFFVGLAVILELSQTSWAVWVAVAIAIAAVAGGFLDVLENNQTLRVLRLSRLDVTTYDLSSLRSYALGKWIVLSAVVGAMSILFWIGSRDFLLYAFGAAWALAGLVGLLGGLGLWRQRLLGAFLLGTAVVAATTCILFLAAPGRFLEGL
jgi:patatin-related protein